MNLNSKKYPDVDKDDRQRWTDFGVYNYSIQTFSSTQKQLDELRKHMNKVNKTHEDESRYKEQRIIVIDRTRSTISRIVFHSSRKCCHQ